MAKIGNMYLGGGGGVVKKNQTISRVILLNASLSYFPTN